MQCDLCGKEEYLVKTMIEGTELKVCKACSRFGRVIRAPQVPHHLIQKPIQKQVQQVPTVEVMELVKDDYAELIKKKREQLHLTQEEFAKKLNEKESFLQGIESGKHFPSIELAKKLEKVLNIVLIEEHRELHEKTNLKEKSNVLTFGDIIKIKK